MDSIPGQRTDPPAEISPQPPSNTVASITAAVSRDSADVTARFMENRSRNAVSSSQQTKRPLKQNDDEKIESLHTRLDVIKHTNAATYAVLQYLTASQNNANKSVLQPAITALEFATQKCEEQIEGVRRDVDNTAAKKKSKQVHNKLNKLAHAQAQEKAAVSAGQAKKDNPKKTLSLAVKSAKEAIDNRCDWVQLQQLS